MKNRAIYENKAAVTGVITHPSAILPTFLKLIFLPPLARPSPRTAPTNACELDTGTKGKEGKLCATSQVFKLTEAKRKSTVELDNIAINAPTGDILKILFPTVIITFLE